MADGNTPILDDENGAITGYVSVYSETGRKFTTEYDADFNVISETVEDLYENLKSLGDMDEGFQNLFPDALSYLGFVDTNSEDFGFVEKDDGRSIQIISFVQNSAGEIVGRVNSWSDTDEYTNWRGDAVEHRGFGYGLHDEEWNYIGSFHGGERYITEDSTGLLYRDESHSNFDIQTIVPGSDAAEEILASWDALNPGVSEIDWDTVDSVRVGEHSWTNYATPDGAYYEREEDFTSSEQRREFFKNVDVKDDEGVVLWTEDEFLGSWVQRDGFVEIYDASWELVSRSMAPGSGATYDDFVESLEEAEAASFEAAWTQIEDYLPSDAADKAVIRFTQNEWGQLFVFGGDEMELLLRINSDSHIDYWEEPWDETFGWSRSEHTWFDIQDANWNQIANVNSWSHSKTTDADYDENLPENSDWVQSETGTNTSFRVYANDVDEVLWTEVFETNYGLPDLAANLDGIWSWGDVTSISIGKSSNTWMAVEGYRDEESGRTGERIEYFEEVDHDDNTDGNVDWVEQSFLGSVEKRDGFLEIRGSDWQLIGEFLDPDSADNFDEISTKVEGFEGAWNTMAGGFPDGWNAESNSFTVDQWDRINVFGDDGQLIGRVNSWSGEDNWTNWRGEEVTNKWSGFHFNDSEWNGIGSVHEGERWITDVDTGETYKDESWSNFDVQTGAPSVDSSEAIIAAWNEFDPDVNEIDWDSVDFVRAGENSWTNYETPVGVENYREADSNSSEARREFFESVDVLDDDGNVLWTQEEFLGSWQQRDGFVEIYDASWELVSRSMAPGSGATYDDFVESLEEAEAASFEAAWTQIEDYLPSDAADKAVIRFTQNEWGQLFVFGGDEMELLLRINSDSHIDYWEEPWDETFGMTRWENSWFDVQDQNWNQIANVSSWTRSKTNLNDYDPEAPEDSSWISDETGTNSSVRIYADDVAEVVWSNFFEEEYSLPEFVTNNYSDSWSWDEVSSISVGQTSYTRLSNEVDGEDSETNISERIEYFSEVEHVNDSDGKVDWVEQVRLGVAEENDGVISIHDGDWNWVGEFIDPDSSSVLSYYEMVEIHAFFGDALEALEDVLPITDVNQLNFVATSDTDFQIFNAGDLILQSHLNYNIYDDGSGENSVNWYVNFNDLEWNQLGSYHGYKQYEDQSLVSSSVSTNVRVNVTEENSQELKTEYGPLESYKATESGIIWTNIDQISVGTRVNNDFDESGEALRSETSSFYEYFSYDDQFNYHEHLGSQEQFGALIKLFDKDWEVIDTSFDNSSVGEGDLSWFGPQSSYAIDIAVNAFRGDIQDLTGVLLEDLEVFQIDETSGYVEDSAGNKIFALSTHLNFEGIDEIYWEVEATPIGNNALSGFTIAGSSDYSADAGGIVVNTNDNSHVKLIYPDIQINLLTGSELKDLKEKISPQGDVEYVDWDNLAIVSGDEWREVTASGEEISSEARVRFVEYDESGSQNWNSDENIWIHVEGAFEFIAEGKGNYVAGFLSRDVSEDELQSFTALGENSELILSNWLSAVESEVTEALGISSIEDITYYSVGQTESAVIKNAAGKIIAFAEGEVDSSPDSYGNVSWGFDVYGVNGNELFSGWGHNELLDTGGLSADGHYGVYFSHPEMIYSDYEGSEWQALVAEYRPAADLDTFDENSIGNIRYEKVIKVNDGDTSENYLRTKFNVMDGNGDINWDWDAPENLLIENRGGVEFYYGGDNSPENFLGAGPVDNNGVATAAFGANTNQIIENWFEVFQEEGLTGDITLDGLTITDAGAQTVIIDEDGQIVFIVSDHWIDESADNNGEFWWGGELTSLSDDYRFKTPDGEETLYLEINGRAAKDENGALDATAGILRFEHWDIRSDDYDTFEEYSAAFNELVDELDIQSDVESDSHLRAQAYQRVVFDTVGDEITVTSRYDQARFVEYDPETREADWESPINVTVQHYEPILVELNSDWNITSVRVYEPDGVLQTPTLTDLATASPMLAGIAEVNAATSNIFQDYEFGVLGVDVIGVYVPGTDDLVSVILDRNWDNQDTWDVFDLTTGEWTARIRSRENDNGVSDQVWIDADLDSLDVNEIATAMMEAVNSFAGDTLIDLDNLPEVAKLMVLEHNVAETGGIYYGFVGFDQSGEYSVDFGVSNNFQPDETTEAQPGTYYSVGLKTAGTEWIDYQISKLDGEDLSQKLENYTENRALEQFFESVDFGLDVHVDLESGTLTYSVGDSSDIELAGILADSNNMSVIEFDATGVTVEKSDIGLSDFGDLEIFMEDILIDSGSNDGSTNSLTLTSSNGLFELLVVGSNDMSEAANVLEDVAYVMFNEYVDLSIEDEFFTSGVAVN